MNPFKDKNILFIGPVFFGYEADICSKISEMGGTVYFIPENVDSVNNLFCVVNRLRPKLKTTIFDHHFNSELKKVESNNIHYVFVIRGRFLSKIFLSGMQEKYSNAKFIMYQWDSIKNTEEVVEIFDFFDVIYTFDKVDYDKYSKIDSKWKFKPLFYVDQYRKIQKKNKYDIDILFIGTYHSRRNSYVNEIKEYCLNNDLRFYSYMYIPFGRFIKRKIHDPEFKDLNYKDLKFKSLSRKKIIELIGNARIILDYQANNQEGLTIRTIESVGARKKLITTNSNVKDYDFYNSNNITITNKEFEPEFLKKDFLLSEYSDIPNEIYTKYSLENWLLEIFNI